MNEISQILKLVKSMDRRLAKIEREEQAREKKYLTMEEIKQEFDYSKKTIENYVKAGIITDYKTKGVGKYRPIVKVSLDDLQNCFEKKIA